MMRLRKHQRGDTMIEVIISIVVLTLILGAAYAITSRALKSARQAQERGEALKIAESQVENIKAKAVAADDPNLYTATNFCFNPGITTENCTFNTLYRVTITSVDRGKTSQFRVQVQWDSLGLGTADQVVMEYRVVDESN